MAILVTGGSGFIGRSVVAALRARGEAVRVADLVPFPDPDVPTIVGDLSEPEVLERALTADCEGVVHLAALTSVLESVSRPAETYRTNVALTAALLERVRALGVPRVVFASSNAVVGSAADGRALGEDAPMRPLTPYGATKAAAEMMMSAYGAAYDVATTTLRLSNAYGPGMARKDSVVPRHMRAARDGGPFELYGDGAQERDFLYVGDAAAAFLLALDRGPLGTLIVASGRSTSVVDLVDAVEAATGRAIDVRPGPVRPGEIRTARLDVTRARALGLAPRTALVDGLGATWADLRG